MRREPGGPGSTALFDERFRLLAACADETIVMTDLEANVVFVNEAGRRLFGAADAADILGQRAFELLAEPARSRTVGELRRVLTDGVARNRASVVRRRDGVEVPIEMTVSVVRDATGLPIGYMSILRDVGERERQQAKSRALLDVAGAIAGRLELGEILEQVQRHVAAALECDAVATFCWDRERRTFRVAGVHGAAFEATLRSSSFEFGRDAPLVDHLSRARTVVINDAAHQEWLPADVLAPLGLQAVLWTQLLVGEKPMGALVAAHTRAGAEFHRDHIELLEAVATQLAQGMDAVEQYRRSQADAASAAARARDLDAANRTKSDFVAAIAHELRSPLSVITGYSSLLLDGAFGELSGEQIDVIQRVDRTTSTLTELVNTLLDFSRLESGQLRLELEDLHVRSLLDAVDEETREVRDRKPGVRFLVDVEGDLPPLHSDALKLKVVLKNLIGNALKFTESGEIRLTAAAVEDGIELRVSDTGAGIAPESLGVIFDAFRQGAGTRRAHGGFGLGLYIVRRLLDLLGGTIRVASEPGHGTTFTVFLPAA